MSQEVKSRVFNQDCLEAMREMPDKAFSLAIVDPPYGINMSVELAERGQSCKKNGYREWEYKDWDGAIPSSEFFSELKRVSNNQIIWGGNYFPLPPTRCWLLWDKGQRDFSFADGELAWTSFDKSVRIFDYARGRVLLENKIHPTQKPVALYKWLLTNYAKPGDTILDTHLGSGSSRIAAYDLGFDFTGYELDKDYFEAQEARFQNHIAQPKLFEPAPIEMEQANIFA